MTELVKQQTRRTYKFIQTLEKKVVDALITEGNKCGVSLQEQIRTVLREWYRRNGHAS